MRSFDYYFRNRSVGDFLFNRLVQRRDPELKIFFIGFNKCATSAIFHFLARQGIKSAHWRHGKKNLALEVEKRASDPAELKRFLLRWTAYSDFTLSSEHLILEGNRHFRLFHEIFPRAFFVLNDRNPEKWIASRIAHRRGEFARRSARLHNCGVEELRGFWLRERDQHNRQVLGHFAGYDRFLHFRVDDDPISKLIDFVSPPFRLKPQHWSQENVSAKRWPRR